MGETVSSLSCTACASAIAPGAKFLVAAGQHFHKTCFVCAECSTPLAASFRQVDSTLLCEDHYLQAHGTKCVACNQFITGRILRILEDAYHVDCLVCASCTVNLEGKPIQVVGSSLYCSVECTP